MLDLRAEHTVPRRAEAQEFAPGLPMAEVSYAEKMSKIFQVSELLELPHSRAACMTVRYLLQQAVPNGALE